jgi:hypothetical protein
MTRRKKIFLWLTSILALMMILMVSIYGILSRGSLLGLINQKMHDELCNQAGCQVDFGGLEVLFFPSPHIVAAQTRISVPGIITGTVQSLSLFPKILPLLSGRVELAKLQVISPDLKITIPSATESNHPAGAQSGNGVTGTLGTGESLSAILGNLAKKVPGLQLQLKNGRIDILHETRSLVLLHGLSADIAIPPDNLRMKVACTSNLWEELIGEFIFRQESPAVSYRIECKNIDASAVRERALALAGESMVVKDIFQIIRGGKVPLLVFDGQGISIDELQKSENLSVRGSLRDGQVFIEKIDLMVSEAQGDVLISHGILEGKNLKGRTGASTASNGSLTVALTRGDGLFHLDMEIDADLAQLPPVLNRVVEDHAFLKELSLLSDVTGRANGRLVLGETLNSIQTSVEVSEWMLKGRYQRLPFPLELQARSLSYEGSRLAVSSLQGRSGKTRWYDVSGSLNWSRGALLELLPSSRARISLDEVFPWLTMLPQVGEQGWKIDSMRGTLRIDTLTFKGILSHPEDWRFLLKGRIEELASHSGMLLDTLTIKSGTISASEQSLHAVGCDLTFSDASMATSGELVWNMEGLRSADFSFRGTIGPDASEWLSGLIHLPTSLRVRTPLSIPGLRLHWVRNGTTTAAGTLQVNGGPEISISADQDPQRLFINPLSIRDDESDAQLTIDMQGGEIDLGFKGNLTTGTLGRLFTENRRFSGSARGDLTAHLVSSRLSDSTAYGTLNIRDFLYLLLPGKTLTVEKASLEAKGSVLQVDNAALRLMGTAFEVGGNVGFGEGHLQVDADLVTTGINWDDLKALASLNDLDSEATADLSDLQFQGTVRLNAGDFTYDSYTWKPLRAKIEFGRDGIHTEVTEASLCTIPTPATIIPSSQGHLLITKLDARNLHLDPTLACLWDRRGAITGVFDLKGEVSALLTRRNMAETLEGKLDFVARKGRVYHSLVLAKIFDLLNVTEIYRGQLPDLANEGCAYDSIKVGAILKHGKLLLENAVFDGLCAKMVGSGEIDLQTRKVNVTILVSPLKTVDSMVRHIPLLGNILGGSLVSIPVRVTGDLSSPTVTPLSPSSVGEGLAAYMKRVFQLPFKLIQPLK